MNELASKRWTGMRKGRVKSISCYGGHLHEDPVVRTKYSPSLLPAAMIKHWAKPTWDRKRCVRLTPGIPSLRKDKLET